MGRNCVPQIVGLGNDMPKHQQIVGSERPHALHIVELDDLIQSKKMFILSEKLYT